MAKFIIHKSSDFNYEEIKEINTLEELMEFVDKNGAIVIEDIFGAPHRIIEIYDTYRE